MRKALERSIEGATKGRGGHQVDVGMAGEVLAERFALLVAEVSEEGVLDDVVGGANVVQAL